MQQMQKTAIGKIVSSMTYKNQKPLRRQENFYAGMRGILKMQISSLLRGDTHLFGMFA